MKKIGILFGQENTFPWAFIDRVNEKIEQQGIKDMVAEAVSIDTVEQAKSDEYAVIIDRISQDVPFYRAYLKNAAITGTAVINNPFWWSADEKFFNNALAEKIGVPVPKTFILPTSHRPEGTDENSFRNMKFPFNWEKMFETIGFPAYMKPHDGGGWKNVYRVDSPEDLFKKHGETENLVMMLQEEIQFTEYFRCYALGTDKIHIMQYEPRNPHHLRYVIDGPEVDKKILDLVEKYCIKLNKALGYDFNTVEFAVRDGVPYAIDFCNPAPDADVNSVGQENFEWIVENAANMAIEKAKQYKKGQMNLTWGTFVTDQMSAPKAVAKKAPAKKATTAKTTAIKKAPVKKAATSKTPDKKTTAKKAPTKKSVAKKSSVRTKTPRK
ncbi:ATP-grasp domain-containing protein [Winogradskyella ursingii]|uniref:ATP-grasp domain-containing protein n=1 Tax=Winogradskyella ursingii TaxID=2686079 RepID=UPI0015CDD939